MAKKVGLPSNYQQKSLNVITLGQAKVKTLTEQ